MGVHGLWSLLGPSGRRVKVDTLEGRILAVDASIWLFQFLKAMRDSEGNTAYGAHLIGFFKRLCKLHFYGILPVVVFDGPPPPLKRRTLSERRKLREQEALLLRRAAERLVVNFVRRKALKTRKGLTKEGADGGPGTVTLRDILYGSKGATVDLEPEPVYDVDNDNDEDVSAHASREEAVQYAAERRARRVAYYESIPTDFRGFLAERRRLDDIQVPSKPDENVEDESTSFSEQMKKYGITLHDVESDRKVKRQIIATLDEFKEYRTVNRLGEETFIQLPLNAEIDETVFKALPSKLQYRILTQLRDKWLGDLRGRAIAARNDPRVFSNVQIESYIRTIKSNLEIENVKRRMGEETKVAHFGLGGEGDGAGSPTDNDNEGGGGFLQFYPGLGAEAEKEKGGDKDGNLSLEEKVRRALADQEKIRSAASESKSIKRATDQMREDAEGQFGNSKRPGKRRKFLELFRTWEEADEAHRAEAMTKALLHPSKPSLTTFSISSVDTSAIASTPVPPDPVDQLEESDDLSCLEEMLTRLPPEEKSIAQEKIDDLTSQQATTSAHPPLKKIRLVKKSIASPTPSPTGGSLADEGEWDAWEEIRKEVAPAAFPSRSKPPHTIPQPTAEKPSILNSQVKKAEQELDSSVRKVKQSKEPLALVAESALNDKGERDEFHQEPASPVDLSAIPESVATTYHPDAEEVPVTPVNIVKISEKKLPPETEGPETGTSSPAESTIEANDENARWLNMDGAEFERTIMERSAAIYRAENDDGVLDSDLLAEQLEEEAMWLTKKIRQAKQRTDDLTDEMSQDVRDLLRAFGVPFVEAPSEAEAQAVWLNQNGLVEGIICDDSDSMVFGAEECFRNFFGEGGRSAPSVEMYSGREGKRCLGLGPTELRLLAMLLGCDYTLGVKGIGIVNALEVIAAFPTLEALEQFGAWARDLSHVSDPCIREADSPAVKSYKQAHFNYRPQWQFPSPFPPQEAYLAFEAPSVNKSREPFTWASPDVAQIKHLMRKRAGMSTDQVMNVLEPVLNRAKARGGVGVVRKQRLIDEFLQRPGDDAVAVYKSERLKKSLKMLTEEISET